jgi:capsular exopolysaccharide synthesis family protein
MKYETLRRPAFAGLELSQDSSKPDNVDSHDFAADAKAASDSEGVILRPPGTVFPRDLSRVPVEQVSPPSSSRLISTERGKSIGAERMRLLRTRLWELRRLGTLNTLAITSSIPKEGKSTIAMNLSTILSDGNRFKVLLIEADLHCPGLGKSLGISNSTGLCECLESGVDPFSVIRRIDPLGWYLMQAGTTQRHPTDLIQSRAFPGVLADVTPNFDWVIVDTPPVLPVADTISICQSTDAVLLVIRSGVTPRENVDEAVEMIGPNRIGAIILNAADDINRSYNKYSSYYGSKK